MDKKLNLYINLAFKAIIMKIKKKIDTAISLLNEGIRLGANHIIVPKHSHFPSKIFDLVNLTERNSESNLKMVYGKEVKQKLDQFCALGNYAKG